MVLVHDTLYHCALEVYEVSIKYLPTLFNLQSGHKSAFSHVTWGIILKINMQELWFLCMIRHLDVLYKCMKFL